MSLRLRQDLQLKDQVRESGRKDALLSYLIHYQVMVMQIHQHLENCHNHNTKPTKKISWELGLLGHEKSKLVA